MKQIDRNFENLMKRVKPDSPSDRFTLSVMQRIQTEAALTPKPLLHDYKPVISRPMWIALAAIFVGFIVFSFDGASRGNRQRTKLALIPE
jgi:hypothetical protein